MPPPSGPLVGLRVVELAGIGPGPFAAMLLADMGAEVVQIERPGGGVIGVPHEQDVLRRGRASVCLDLRQPAGVDAALSLIDRADVLLEGYRPGVTERLGLGPETCLARNPKLVYGRMTGWGQDGPLAQTAGHDVGYLALTGALHAIGDAERPTIPLNLIGDFGGGSLYLVVGVLAALHEASRSGQGQVVDAAIVDGAASLTTMMHGFMAAGAWQDRRASNLLDGGAPWYAVYETADRAHLALGALEPRFYAALMEGLGLTADEAERADPAQWPALRERIAAAVAARTRDEWAEVFAATDACVAPVLTMGEAPDHPHLATRGTFVEVGGVRQPGPAPRFSRTASAVQGPPVALGANTAEVMSRWGVRDVDALLADGVAVQSEG